MLQKLNERIQGIIAWVVIILIALTFTLFGVDYYMQSRQVSDVEVTINGEGLTKQAFEVNYRRARQQRESRQISVASDSALKKQVLEDMIANVVTVQSASNDGFQVSKKQANVAILTIPQFQQDGQFSAQRYQQALSAAMYTPESFQNQVQQGMLLSQQRFSLMGTAFALPNEIKQFVKLYMQTRDYNYVIIPRLQFVNKVEVTSSDVTAYYNKHKQDFIEPEKVSIDYVRLSMEQIKLQTSISDEAIKSYYKENEPNFTTPLQWQLENILFSVPKGASSETENAVKQKAMEAYQLLKKDPSQFPQMVKSMSQDKSVALVNTLFSNKPAVFSNKKMSLGQNKGNKEVATGGTLSWITAGTTQFDKVLARLTTPGQISTPVKTANGYEIFKLIATKQPKLKPFNQVSEAIKTQLLTEVTQANYSQALEQLTDLSYQTPDSLSEVAQALKLPIETSVLFSREASNNPYLKNMPVLNAIFSHDVLDLGNNSEPLQLDNDSVIVLRIKQHFPAQQQQLAQVRQQIVAKLTALEARHLAENFGRRMLTNSSLATENKVIAENKLVWHPVENAGRDSDTTDSLISELAFNLPRKNSQAGRSLQNGDYVIVKLKAVHDGQYQLLDREQQASLVQQIEASYGVMDYDLYVNSLVTTAKIDRQP